MGSTPRIRRNALVIDPTREQPAPTLTFFTSRAPAVLNNLFNRAEYLMV
jgi:hypothetical protein